MPLGRGVDSYIAWGPQTAHGTKATPGNVQVNLRTGRIYTPQDFMMARESSGVIMPKRGQMWAAPKIVNWAVAFEWTTDLASGSIVGTIQNLGTMLNAAMGHYLKSGVTPTVLRKLNFANPPIDGAADTATDFYGRALTFEHVIKGCRAYDIHDAVITQLQLVMEAGKPIRTEISGVGALFEDIAIGSAVAFSDLSGTLITWQHLIGATTVSGFFAGTANPLTASDQLNCRKCVIKISPNLRVDPALGLPTGQQYKLPDRSSEPTIEATVDMDFEQGTTGWDAADAATAFAAATRTNFAARAQVDASNIIDFTATAAAASAPGLVVDPGIDFGGSGVMGFSHTIRFYPEAPTTDVLFNITSDT